MLLPPRPKRGGRWSDLYFGNCPFLRELLSYRVDYAFDMLAACRCQKYNVDTSHSSG